jgi:flagellar motility protein MotE (MotC chaperone)
MIEPTHGEHLPSDGAVVVDAGMNPAPAAREKKEMVVDTGKQAESAVTEKRRAGASTPPSLAPSAFCEELRRAANRQTVSKSQLQEERTALAAERGKLQKLAAELEASRKELRAEATRLDVLLTAAGHKLPKESNTSTTAENGGAPQETPVRKAEEKPRSPEQLSSLAKAIRSMKAEQAAALVSRLEHSLAVDLLQHMSPKAAGAVMANVKPELAAELMASMANRVASPSKEGRP